MTVACIVQARMGSTRFPGKVLANLAGKPVLQHVLERCKEIKGVDVVVCAIPSSDRALYAIEQGEGFVTEDGCALLHAHLFSWGFNRFTYWGDENDVLDRYLQCAKRHEADIIMRITADCPLIDPDVCWKVLATHQDSQGKYEYVSNVEPRTYPQGYDCEVFSMAVLERAASAAIEPYDREHVTPWMQRNCVTANVFQDYDASHVRWTVDYPEDIARLEQVMAEAA